MQLWRARTARAVAVLNLLCRSDPKRKRRIACASHYAFTGRSQVPPQPPVFKSMAAALALLLACAAGAQTADAPPSPPNEQNSQNLQLPQSPRVPQNSLDSPSEQNPQPSPNPPNPAKPPRQRFSGATELVMLAAVRRATS